MEVKIRSSQEVAKRVMVLWAIDMIAEGVDRKEATRHLSKLRISDAVSPEEKEFLDDPDPDPGYCRYLVWRLESIWVLMWALGYIEVLDWPSGTCNTKEMVPILESEKLRRDFITNASLRPTSEILDEQDLIMRVHWSVRHVTVNDLPMPANLDWAQPDEWIVASGTVAGAVVEQRHYVLNWLARFQDADWDDVDTPT